MKASKILTLSSIVLTLASCNSSKVAEKTNKSSKTYAEISVKEGGSWNGKKYEGGTFKNVQSLQLSENHTDHSFDIRYEGPGWESNKIGYRLYLDWRNAIDIYGKLTEDMVLSQVGLDGFDSYHKMSDWGADILKVGKGLGIGSIGRVINDEMHHFNNVEDTFVEIENSKTNSKVKINYKGWKTNNQLTNLNSELTIFPNERYTRHTIQFSESLDGICTGIVNLHGLEMVQKLSENKKWGYIATYGKQTLFDDNLGMAIFYKVENAEKVYKGKNDYLIQFKPSKEKITFYFLGAWEKEVNGIKTEKEFYHYLDNYLNKLNSTNKLD